jgi:hypothetical protein
MVNRGVDRKKKKDKRKKIERHIRRHCLARWQRTPMLYAIRFARAETTGVPSIISLKLLQSASV